MKDKYLLSVGAGVILLSFGILIYFMVSSSIDNKLETENQTIGFEQLNDATRKNVLNNSAVEQFKDLVGKAVDEVDERVTIIINDTN